MIGSDSDAEIFSLFIREIKGENLIHSMEDVGGSLLYEKSKELM